MKKMIKKVIVPMLVIAILFAVLRPRCQYPDGKRGGRCRKKKAV